MIQLYRIQDIQLDDVEIKDQYYQLFLSGQVAQAQSLYRTNPQLEGKVLNSDMLNKMVNGIFTLQNLWFNNVPQYLSNLHMQMQMSIDELIYMTLFNPELQYEVNNFVMYNEAIYFCFNKPPIGTFPTDTNYWLHLGLKGEVGKTSLGVSYKGAWTSTATFQLKDMVVYQNCLYVAKTINTGKTPKTSPDDWLLAVEIIPKGIYVSDKIPPNLQDGDVWIKTNIGAYTWSQIDTFNYSFKEIDELQIDFRFIDTGGWGR